MEIHLTEAERARLIGLSVEASRQAAAHTRGGRLDGAVFPSDNGAQYCSRGPPHGRWSDLPPLPEPRSRGRRGKVLELLAARPWLTWEGCRAAASASRTVPMVPSGLHQQARDRPLRPHPHERLSLCQQAQRRQRPGGIVRCLHGEPGEKFGLGRPHLTRLTYPCPRRSTVPPVPGAS